VLTSLLKSDAVPFATLHARYGGLLELVRTLIGVVPNCDPYLEIWPPAFRTYNVMVPNFLNLPLLIWGLSAPRDVVGLAMYASSRAAGCAYCSAHTCTFALRRGAPAGKVARATGDDLTSYTRAERAAVAMARALSSVPASFTAAHREELSASFSRADAEWIFLAVAMMGFLNKFMDALGVELEGATVEEVHDVIAPSGWSSGKHGNGGADPSGGAPPRPDGIATQLGILRHAPGALSLDSKWTAGVPARWPRVGNFLRERTGHDFPVLARLTHGRAIRALATMLRDNLDSKTSVIGVARKLDAGAIYARAVGNGAVEAQLRKLGAAERDARVEALAHAIAPSPAVVDEGVVNVCRDLPPAAIVEVVTFVSVVQLWHRVETFYAA
jgi:alkylhydroperoxidase family enzyme